MWNDQQFLMSTVLPLLCDAETANWNYQLYTLTDCHVMNEREAIHA